MILLHEEAANPCLKCWKYSTISSSDIKCTLDSVRIVIVGNQLLITLHCLKTGQSMQDIMNTVDTA